MMMLPDPTEVMPTRKPAIKPDYRHPCQTFHRGRAISDSFFDAPLEQHQRGNDDEQHAHRGLDEVVYAITVKVTDVHQQVYSGNRAGNAAQPQERAPPCGAPCPS